jgi:hypothetical protein
MRCIHEKSAPVILDLVFFFAVFVFSKSGVHSFLEVSMKKQFYPFALLSLPLMMAACGQTSAPTASTGPLTTQAIRVHIGPSGKLAAQGLPTGPGFSVAQTHLKVKVVARDGSPVTFKAGVYAPGNDGDAFLILNAQNNFSQDVLLPAGEYTFETIAKDGTDEEASQGTLLAYSKSELTTLDAGHTNVQLTVHTVMNTKATALRFALPTGTVYTNDTVGLRLNVKTNSVPDGDGAASYSVPTSDFTVGAYTAINGTVNASTASKLGVSFTATGSLADRTTTVLVPVTGWIQDGSESASLGTVTVTFQHDVAAGTVSADVTPPTATFNVASAPVEIGNTVTLNGSAQDADGGNISAARLYDGTTLIASTDNTEVNENVQLLTFPDGGTTWNANWTPSVLGSHGLTLVVDDAAGNEATAEQSASVMPAVFRDTQAPTINIESIQFESGQGSAFFFVANDNVCVSSALVFMNGQVIGEGSSSDSCERHTPSTPRSFVAPLNGQVILTPGDVVSIVAYDMAGNESAPVSYTIPGTRVSVP